MRRGVVLMLAIVSTVVFAVAAFAAQSPKARLTAMQQAVAGRSSVHYVTVSTGAPGQAERMVCDVGRGRGIQRITFTKAGKTGPATVIVADRSAYIRGDRFTLHDYFGFTKTQSSRYAGKWIAIPHSSPGYSSVAADATFASFRSFLFPRQKLAIVSAGSLVGVRGTAREQGIEVAATVYAPAHGTALPTEARASSPGHPGKSRMTMTRWNEPVRVTAPAHAVPISTVVGG